MPVNQSVGSHWKFRRPVLLGAVIGAPTVAATLWMSGPYNWSKAPAGPFLEFEMRLPPGILLPGDNNIEVTFWSDGTGRGCHGVEVRLAVGPPEIAGRCSIVEYGREYVRSA